MKNKLFLLLALAALTLSGCAKGNSSSQDGSSVTPPPSSESSGSQSSEASSEISSEESSESETSSEEDRVAEFSVEGVIAPAAGEHAVIFGFVTDFSDATVSQDDCYWFYVENGDEYIFAEAGQNDKIFEQGMQYGIKIGVELNEKIFSEHPTIYLHIDGEYIEPERVEPYAEYKKASAYFYFDTLPGPRLLHRIAITSYPKPVVGQVAPAVAPLVTVEPANCLKVNSYNSYWLYYPYGPNDGWFFSRGNDDSKVFEAGVKYGLAIVIEPKDYDDYAFAEDIVVLVDGQPAEYETVGSHSDICVEIKFDTGSEPPDIDMPVGTLS